MLDKRQFYINGKWVNPFQKHDFNVINPSNESVCAVISLGGVVDVNTAVLAAKDAFKSWSLTSKKERLELLENLYSIYKRRASEMGEAISLEMGAPKDLSNSSQVGAGIGHIKSTIEAFKNFDFVRALGEHAPNDRILYEPIGVCGLITPWNWPMNQVTLKVIPALAAGCTMILKPSEIAPLSSMLFSEMLDEAGFPSGVYNMINGDGLGVGSILSGHEDVDMISFTGSARAGSLISKNAANTIKKVSLELGGKGANIIFADADEKAVKRGVFHCFNNSGQSCNAPSRMLVERSIYEQSIEEALAAAQISSVDIASKSGRHIGPVVSKEQYDKIQKHIQIGIDEGARLLAGGLGKADGHTKGYFVKPTLFADVNNSMTIAREEIFGPVLSIIPFNTVEEAIEIANDTEFGLTNYIETLDMDKAVAVAKRLRSGMVEINGESRGAGAPFGGYKKSGNGREGGVWGLEDYLEIKAVSGWREG